MLYGVRTMAWSAMLITSTEAFQVAPIGHVRTALRGSSVVQMDAIPTVPDAEMTKKNVRRQIMSKDSYKRGGAPFEKAIHADVNSKMSERFAGQLVEDMKQSTFRELKKGEGDREVTFVLAKEFGFCWGVERSIELAWAAREAYPDKTMHITNELIHNPGVNDLLGGMGIKFMEKDENAVGGKRFDTVADGDVVILPAFGASLEEMELLDAKGVTTVDTTCPWVSKVRLACTCTMPMLMHMPVGSPRYRSHARTWRPCSRVWPSSICRIRYTPGTWHWQLPGFKRALPQHVTGVDDGRQAPEGRHDLGDPRQIPARGGNRHRVDVRYVSDNQGHEAGNRGGIVHPTGARLPHRRRVYG